MRTLTAHGTTTLGVLYNHQDIYLLQTPPNTSPETLVELMSVDPNLEWAELNFLTDSPETGSSDRIYGWGGYDSALYHGQAIVKVLKLDEAHQYSRGSGTVIALLDTGAQLDHPELVGSLDTSGFDFVDKPCLNQANGKMTMDADDGGYGHGTHVTGIALVVPESP
jgi:subtilisin family serine protease